MYEKGTVETRYKAEKPCATPVGGAKNDADADATITRGSFYRAKIINVFNGRAPPKQCHSKCILRLCSSANGGGEKKKGYFGDVYCFSGIRGRDSF